MFDPVLPSVGCCGIQPETIVELTLMRPKPLMTSSIMKTFILCSVAVPPLQSLPACAEDVDPECADGKEKHGHDDVQLRQGYFTSREVTVRVFLHNTNLETIDRDVQCLVNWD